MEFRERECVVIIKRPLNTIILPARVQLVTQFYIAEEGGWYYDYRFVLIILIHPRLALLLLLFDGGGWLFEYQELYNLLAKSSKQAPCTCHGLITLHSTVYRVTTITQDTMYDWYQRILVGLVFIYYYLPIVNHESKQNQFLTPPFCIPDPSNQPPKTDWRQ